MKTLILVRHAEAVSSLGQSSDFDRALTEKGKRQALEMRQYLAHFPSIHVLCSPSQRTQQTAFHLLQHFPYTIDFLPKFYNATATTIGQAIESHTEHNTLMIIAHNPGITQIYYELTQQWVAFEPCSMGIITLSNEENERTINDTPYLGNFVTPQENE